ncbi:glutathione S-transferase family protein [Phormidesmis priestleyi ULC007]|uniref:Glutathione S-transferase family protein n=1 Tax=Phormidesmis priestleyi ULC007 TaxID=1920490 RepID=A0A2T1DEW5_9CYAN|nr:glutathione S-transferase family protein [Phormidesmis priestleyi]PSB19016.1 glutathione S-transferase family protein [Phormidesmis priestleyi ULC007]PZO54004.1 MAG: glutathione S-transferase family protein [Phormidesmis priestleyi]
MLELYQFEMSHYAEKVRLILDYKGLEYRKIEVTPGVGQIELYQLSGQRQVPVLKDGSEIIADSTAIAEYLDKKYPEKPIIPSEPKQKGLCLLIEQWADESIGLNARKGLIGSIGSNQNFRTALLPNSVPDVFKNLVGAIPQELFGFLGMGMGADAVKDAQAALKRDLTALCFILLEQPYLLGDTPTLADFAVAGLTMYVKFPTGSYLNIPEALKGQGISGIADVGTFEPFFTWRDKLYADFRKSSPFATPSGSSPTSIDID